MVNRPAGLLHVREGVEAHRLGRHVAAVRLDALYEYAKMHGEDDQAERQKTKEGADIWRLVMTSGGGWNDAEGMSEWCRDCASGVRACFFVMKARMSADSRGIWLVCNPHTSTYFLVCRYNFEGNSFRVLCDGDTVDEQADGTILIKN